jgi:hypothetical protein
MEERVRAAWTRWRSVRGQHWTWQVVSEALAVDPTAISEATAVQAWRRLRSGRTGGREMVVARVRV